MESDADFGQRVSPPAVPVPAEEQLGPAPRSELVRALLSLFAPLFADPIISFALSVVPLWLASSSGLVVGILSVCLFETVRACGQREQEWREWAASRNLARQAETIGPAEVASQEAKDLNTTDSPLDPTRPSRSSKTPLRRAVRTPSGVSFGIFRLSDKETSGKASKSQSPPRKRPRRRDSERGDGVGLGINGLATPPETPDVRNVFGNTGLHEEEGAESSEAVGKREEDAPPPPYDVSTSTSTSASSETSSPAISLETTPIKFRPSRQTTQIKLPQLSLDISTPMSLCPMSATTEPIIPTAFLPGSYSPTFSMPSPTPSAPLPATGTRLHRENRQLRRLLSKARHEIEELEQALLEKGLELGKRVLQDEMNKDGDRLSFERLLSRVSTASREHTSLVGESEGSSLQPVEEAQLSTEL